MRALAGVLILLAGCDGGGRAAPPPERSEDLLADLVPEDLRTPRPFEDPVDGEDGAVTLRDMPLENRFPRLSGPLEWLSRHQDRDGSWSSYAFVVGCPGRACSAPSAENETVGVTGLALMGYLAYGETHKTGTHGGAVRAGLRHLKSIQGPEGEFARPWNAHPGLQNAWASCAMIESYAMTQSPLFREPAERAIRFLEASRLPAGGWRKEARGGEPDLETTAWSVMALRAAQNGELPVDPEVFRRTLGWLDGIIDPKTGRVGTDRRTEAETAMTAVARMCCRRALGMPADPLWERMAEVIAERPPAWDPTPGAMDARARYFGTLCCYIRRVVLASRKGTPEYDRSVLWCNGMMSLDKDVPFVTEGCARGSCDPFEPWGREHGRVASTAMEAMMTSFFF